MVETYRRACSNDFCQVGIKLNLESNLNQNVSVKEIQQIRVFSLYVRFPDKTHLSLLHQNGSKLKQLTCLGKKTQI